MTLQYRCPLCQQSLTLTERTLRCPQGHCFDLAKEGYVNLLPAQNKRSKAPGDTDEMLRARRRFLAAGYFQPLIDTLSTGIRQLPEIRSLLDIGCGEGYYLRALGKLLPAETFGIDIAKTGVRMAAKQQRQCNFSVASAAHLPFDDNSFDLALSVFAPAFGEECVRILKPGASLLIVGPGPSHLQGLAARIYDQVKEHQGNFQNVEGVAQLQLVSEQTAGADIKVMGSAVKDLLQMTPYYWHTSAERQAEMAACDELVTPIEFVIRHYQRL